ncbi:hypothetical protein INT46_007064 [Mucor plumbeus]|uniref:Cytochrome P450 n=1 Tax=Mucor plumbeus TaxID=97098 RepID=A0A8H7RRZ2_9FUNG|nr:hypothetical protein INT46_007064 [Mucor plumbeus]
MDYQQVTRHLEIFSQQTSKYLSNRSNLEAIGKITAISVATYVVVDKLYGAFFGPLSSLPGPLWSKFITFPKSIYNRPSGTSYQSILAFHDKYGEIVRLGPELISVASKDLLKQVLITDDFPKGKLYDAFQISPAFSIKYINALEPFMHKVTESLIYKIDSDIAKNNDELNYGTVDIWGLAQRLALDVIGETAFGQTFNMVENNDHFVPTAISEEMRATAISILYPTLAKLFLKNGGKADPKLKDFMIGVIQNRLQSSKEAGDKQRKDILQFLINVQQAADADDTLTIDSIISETTLFLIAGSETTSNSIGFVFINLMRNPKNLKKLYKELDTIEFEQGQIVFHHEQLKHLPYLNAVINETLRVDSIAAAGLMRRAPKDTVLDGRIFVPKDTTVICSLYHAQMNSKYWSHPEEFRPERWLDQDDEVNDLEAFFAWSAGTRNCIGKNFALQEMRILIATMLKTYDIQPIEQEMIGSHERRQFITLTLPNNSFNIKIKRRS